jgi:hypothetical protein
VYGRAQTARRGYQRYASALHRLWIVGAGKIWVAHCRRVPHQAVSFQFLKRIPFKVKFQDQICFALIVVTGRFMSSSAGL